MTFIFTFHAWVLALAANILVFSLVPIMPKPGRDGGIFLPNLGRDLATLAYLALAIFLTPCIWLAWALLTRN